METGNLAKWNLSKDLKKSQVTDTFLRVFNSQQQDGKMGSSLLLLSAAARLGTGHDITFSFLKLAQPRGLPLKILCGARG